MAVKNTANSNSNSYVQRLLGEHLLAIIPPGMRILLFGCGDGSLLNLLQPSAGTGIEADACAVEKARRMYPHLRFIEGDIVSIDLEESPYDYVIMVNTLGYIEDIQGAFRLMQKCSSRHTRVVIIHPSYLWAALCRAAELFFMRTQEARINWLSMQDIEGIIRLEGFEVVRREQSVLIPVYIPILSAVCNRYLSRLPLFWRGGLRETLVARLLSCERPNRLPSCSVVIPARNERGTIEDAVRRIPDMGSHTEILFVEGHSSDDTLAEILRVIERYPHRDIKVLTQDNDGKADAVRKGFEQATGDIFIILDADLTVRPEDLQKFYDAVAFGYGELVIGNRLVYQLEKESMRLLNNIANKVFSLTFSYLLNQPIKDTLCGTKALTRKHFRRISANRAYFEELDPFGDFDLIFGAVRACLKIVEIPVRYQARQYGETQIKRFQHGLLLFRMVCIAMRKLKFT